MATDRQRGRAAGGGLEQVEAGGAHCITRTENRRFEPLSAPACPYKRAIQIPIYYWKYRGYGNVLGGPGRS